MNRLQGIAGATVLVALLSAPIATHAEDAPPDPHFAEQLNCDTELVRAVMDGVELWYPAIDYEIVLNCGHEQTIAWPDVAYSYGPMPLEFWDQFITPPAAPVQARTPVPVPVYEEPTVVAAPAPVVAPPPVVKIPTALLHPVKGYGRP